MVTPKGLVTACLFVLTLLTGFGCKSAAGEGAGQTGAGISEPPTMLPQRGSRPARITGAIDESALVTLNGSTHPLAQTKFDRGPAPLSMQANRLLLVLLRSKQQEAELETYLESVQDASSPNYHKFLSPVEFGKSFGIGDADLETIRTWLTGHGFTVNNVSKGRMAIEFSGSVGQVQEAFHTSIHGYGINGEQHWANATNLEIPSALAPVVAGMASLNNFKPRSLAILGPSGTYDAKKHTISPTYTIGDSSNGYYIFLGPADAATIYDTPTALNPNRSGTAYDGTGVTIGIAGDSNIDVSQNANYRSTFGLAAKATTVVVDGSDPGENGDAIEAYLDTEVAGGIAPNASVILYTAANTDLSDGLFLATARALDDNQADILNVSFIGCEPAQGTAGNQYILGLWEQAAAQGISVTVASGDSGSAACDNDNTETEASHGLSVNGLGSTPYNISVGGTDFDVLYSDFPASFNEYVNLSNTLPNHRSALSYIPEEPWNDSSVLNTDVAGNKPVSVLSGNSADDNIVATGGGVSSVYPVPTWQATFAKGNGRNLPDVSLLAGNGFYGALWGLCTDLDRAGTDCAAGATANNFNLTGVGGTSASAPAFAGILALVEQKTGSRLGQADYVLYDLAKTKYSTVFHDVDTGDNSVDCAYGSIGCAQNTAGYDFMTGYNATTGYDQASGLGSVDASHLSSDWAEAGFAPSTSSLKFNGSTSALSITHGQSVSVAASVASSGGTAAGVVGLVDSLSPATNPDSESIADFTLASGAVSATTDAFPGGSYSVSAHYGGSGSIAESDSNSIPVTVAPENSTTSLKLSGVYDPASGKAAPIAYYGFIYLLDAQPYGNSASAANPNGPATGSITYSLGATKLGNAAIASSGVAELSTSIIPAGTNNVTAAFPGDPSFLASTSSPLPVMIVQSPTYLVEPASTGTLLTAGASITFSTFFNNDSLGAPPTGNVAFQSDSKAIGTGPIVQSPGSNYEGGNSFFTTSLLPAGTHSITASYPGDSNYSASPVSDPLSVTIYPASVNLMITPSASSLPSNQPLQIQVTGVPEGGLPAPTGAITLTATGYTSPATNLVNGSANFTIPANTLPTGPDTVTVTYPGDIYYAGGTNTVVVTVNPTGTMTPTVALKPAATPYRTLPGNLTVKVAGGAGNPEPTGSVLLVLNGAYSLPPQALVGGSTTFSLTSGFLGYGSSSLTATYYGDSNYTAGTATVMVLYAAAPMITVTPASPSIVVDQALDVTIGVAFNYLPAPSGTITLSSGMYTSAPTAISYSAAGTVITIPANSLAVGADTLTVTYGGDSAYNPSTGSASVAVTALGPPGLTVVGTAVTLAPGASTGNMSTVTVTPSDGFTGNVALTAQLATSPTGAHDLPTFSFGATTPVNITGASAGTATLTISTTAPSTGASVGPKMRGTPWYFEGGAALACLLLIGVPARRRRWRGMLGLLGLFVFLSAGVFACGGGGGGGTSPPPVTNPGTTPGTYTITVTATSGALTQTATVTLTVQ